MAATAPLSSLLLRMNTTNAPNTPAMGAYSRNVSESPDAKVKLAKNTPMAGVYSIVEACRDRCPALVSIMVDAISPCMNGSMTPETDMTAYGMKLVTARKSRSRHRFRGVNMNFDFIPQNPYPPQSGGIYSTIR